MSLQLGIKIVLFTYSSRLTLNIYGSKIRQLNCCRSYILDVSQSCILLKHIILSRLEQRIISVNVGNFTK